MQTEKLTEQLSVAQDAICQDSDRLFSVYNIFNTRTLRTNQVNQQQTHCEISNQIHIRLLTKVVVMRRRRGRVNSNR